MRYTFSKSQRVRRGSTFALVLRRGGCAADGVLVVFALPTEGDGTARLGVTVPKKTGNAVQRNRWKRLIRESFRTQQDRIPSGFDFIVRPKKDARPDWRAIQKSLPRLTVKAAQRQQAMAGKKKDTTITE